MSQNEQLISHLIAARDSLTPDNWRKENYFQTESGNPNICMCAHGALQLQVNPRCRKAYEENRVEDASDEASDVSAAATAHDASMRANYTKRSLQQLCYDYELNENKAHYLLGLVGLTASFNDHPNTTLEMVKAKFDEAIQLARTLD